MMNWSSVFGLKQDIVMKDYSIIGTDIHSHLLPGLDDGSSSMEESLEMIRGMQELGYKKLIITPHIMEGFAMNSPMGILTGLAYLENAVKMAGLDITVNAGAEYMVSDEFELLLNSGDLISFSDKHILLELSTYAPHYNFKSILFKLHVAGYTVILAHPERYSYWFNDLNVFEELQASGVLLQVNTLSFTGYYSGNVRRNAEILADAGMIDLLGTDMHHPASLPFFKEALYKKPVQKLLASGNLKNSLL
jgi:protein-tyrosine phosphatase